MDERGSAVATSPEASIRIHETQSQGSNHILKLVEAISLRDISGGLGEPHHLDLVI